MDKQAAYIEGFVKRANEYGVSSEQAVQLLKSAHKLTSQEYEKARVSPGLAALTNVLSIPTGLAGAALGPVGLSAGAILPSLLHESYIDHRNADVSGLTEARKIDPDKLFSASRGAAVQGSSYSSIANKEKLKKMLLLGGLGAALGGSFGSTAPGLGTGMGALGGAAIGGLAGGAIGSYSGAKAYNKMLQEKE